MNKKRIVSALLALVLVINIAFAVEAKAEASETKEVTVMTVSEDAPESITRTQEAVKRTGSDSFSEEPFEVKTMLYDSYSNPDYTTYKFPQSYWRIIPVTPEHTGCMYLDMKVYGNESDMLGVYVVDSYKSNEEGIYDIEYRMTEDGYYTGWNINGQETKTRLFLPATKGETFWLFVQTGNDNTSNITLNIRARVFTTLQRTVNQSAKNWVTVSGINKSGKVNTTWFKIKPTKTGVLSFKLKEFGNSVSDGYVRLYNIDKKAVSNTVVYSDADDVSRAFFGVKKGRTYYVKVTNCGGSANQYYKYGVKYSVTEKTDRALGSKSDAKTLKRKAKATETLFVASTSKSTDWYKFKVEEKRITKVEIDARSIKSGNLYLYIYKGKQLLGEAKIDNNTLAVYSIKTKSSSQALPGTYYIKVVKGTKASGKYSVKYVR